MVCFNLKIYNTLPHSLRYCFPAPQVIAWIFAIISYLGLVHARPKKLPSSDGLSKLKSYIQFSVAQAGVPARTAIFRCENTSLMWCILEMCAKLLMYFYVYNHYTCQLTGSQYINCALTRFIKQFLPISCQMTFICKGGVL